MATNLKPSATRRDDLKGSESNVLLTESDALLLRSRDEARRLVELAECRTTASNSELYRAIADLFERRSAELSAEEQQLAVEILVHLGGEVARDVRKELACRLANNPAAPHALVVMLANDEIDVCHDLLVNSPVLENPDLIEIVRHRSNAHRLGIAIRQGLAEEVTAVLIACNEEQVIVTLLNNPTARFFPASMRQLVARSRDVETYRAPLVRRSDLPQALAQELLVWVSVALRTEILRRFDIDPESLDAELVDAASIATVDGDRQQNGNKPSAAERLVDKLSMAGELTPGFAVKALKQGQVIVFEMALARLTRLALGDIRRIVFDPAGEGLAVTCRAINLDRAAFRALIHLVRKAWTAEELAASKSVDDMVRFYDSLAPNAAKATLETWRMAHNGSAPAAN